MTERILVRSHLRKIAGRKRKKLIKSYYRRAKGTRTPENNEGGDAG